MPADEARTALGGDTFADQVLRDRATAQSLGITSVPFVVLDGRLGVAGAQSVEGYERALRAALEEGS
ncbi:DsbA family protein [Klenkia sp. PcliD-1-E]|uniref:DsbA family oxidoreductase n=1 Tax=Klenkia sp. PcliD-1-E TaxID=2954492 RepID=UPI002097FBDA|nr:DsbA family protein [Klenkia sp. PcliD-1-E]MCO7221119.1 DsbA family protein [Klenkia sp. PcliD-1-E]